MTALSDDILLSSARSSAKYNLKSFPKVELCHSVNIAENTLTSVNMNKQNHTTKYFDLAHLFSLI